VDLRRNLCGKSWMCMTEGDTYELWGMHQYDQEHFRLVLVRSAMLDRTIISKFAGNTLMMYAWDAILGILTEIVRLLLEVWSEDVFQGQGQQVWDMQSNCTLFQNTGVYANSVDLYGPLNLTNYLHVYRSQWSNADTDTMVGHVPFHDNSVYYADDKICICDSQWVDQYRSEKCSRNDAVLGGDAQSRRWCVSVRV
jgi:hypothetical protein